MANNSSHDILIKILTAFDAGGIDAAKKAATELSKEMKDNSKESEELSFWMKLMEKDAGKAARIFGGLTGALNGSISGVRGLSTALRTFAGIMGASGPVMLAISAASFALTGLIKLYNAKKEAAEAAAKAAKDAAEATAKAEEDAAERAAKAIEELNQVKAEAIKKEIDAVTQRLNLANAAAKNLNAELAARESAELGLQFANIDLAVENNEMTEIDARYEKARLRLEMEKTQLRRDQNTANEAVAAAEKEKEDAAVAAREARAAANEAKRLEDEAIAEMEAAHQDVFMPAVAARDAARKRYEEDVIRGARHRVSMDGNPYLASLNNAEAELEKAFSLSEQLVKNVNELSKTTETAMFNAAVKEAAEQGMLAADSDQNKDIRAGRAAAERLETNIREREITLETEKIKRNKAIVEAEQKRLKDAEDAAEKAEKKRQEEEARIRKAAEQLEAGTTVDARIEKAALHARQNASTWTAGRAGFYPEGSDVDRRGDEAAELAVRAAGAAVAAGQDYEAVFISLKETLEGLTIQLRDIEVIRSALAQIQSQISKSR